MFCISTESASFFFYTDDEQQYPEGPHFSVYFYVTVMGIVACFMAIAGTLFYNRWLSTWRWRSVFIFTNLFAMLGNLTSIVFYKRWNLLLGIPDQLFVLGTESIQVILFEWTLVPIKIMMFQLCPPGLEATMFALLAGSSNLGAGLSQYQGAFVLDMLNVTPSGAAGESAKFEWLWLAALIHAVGPIIPLMLVFVLIPDRPQTECLLEVTAMEQQLKSAYAQNGQITIDDPIDRSDDFSEYENIQLEPR